MGQWTMVRKNRSYLHFTLTTSLAAALALGPSLSWGARAAGEERLGIARPLANEGQATSPLSAPVSLSRLRSQEVSVAIVIDPHSGQPICQVLAHESPELFPGQLMTVSGEAETPLANIRRCGEAERPLLAQMAAGARLSTQTANPFALVAAPLATCALAAIFGGIAGWGLTVIDDSSSGRLRVNHDLDQDLKRASNEGVLGGAGTGGATIAAEHLIIRYLFDSGYGGPAFWGNFVGGTVVGVVCGAIGGQAASFLYLWKHPYTQRD